MVTEAPPTLVTAEELLRLSAKGFYGELIRGELCEAMPPGIRHGKIVARIAALLLFFVDPKKLGTVVAGDPGVWLEQDPDTVRGPDVAFFSVENMPIDADIPGYSEVVPDLVVEVRSPNDSRQRVHDKAMMWLECGVRVVWVVLPETRSVDLYRPDREIFTVSASESLEGLDVLPGFNCTLTDIIGPAVKAG